MTEQPVGAHHFRWIAVGGLLAAMLLSACSNISPQLTVSVAPNGRWTRDMCVRDWMTQDAYRRCVGSIGAIAFTVTVHNDGGRTVAFATCQVQASDDAGGVIGTTVVPVRYTYGVPFDAARLDGGQTLTFDWFIPARSLPDRLNPLPTRFAGSCPAEFDNGPYPS